MAQFLDCQLNLGDGIIEIATDTDICIDTLIGVVIFVHLVFITESAKQVSGTAPHVVTESFARLPSPDHGDIERHSGQLLRRW